MSTTDGKLIAVGNKVGACGVGDAVGLPLDGFTVGIKLGYLEGEKLGCLVGTMVDGDQLGVADGDWLGAIDGR